MTAELEKMLGEAVSLAPEERAELVEGILSSFDIPDRQQIDTAWAEESESRLEAYNCGEIASAPAAMVVERIYKTNHK